MKTGFLAGFVAGFAAFFVVYKIAKPAILREAKERIPGIVRRSVNVGTNRIIDAVGGDATLRIASAEIVDLVGEKLP